MHYVYISGILRLYFCALFFKKPIDNLLIKVYNKVIRLRVI
nr:MAG TPA: hypothetical protein [Caudoviricetes sp.]